MTNNKPLVSVIVSTYNRIELLLETIDSILKQTFSDFELIIVDDGSTDNTEQQVKEIEDSRIRYIKIPNWGGPAVPRNIGIDNSIGDYLAFCDDDDVWFENKLEKQLKHFENQEIIGVGALTRKIGALKYHRDKTIEEDQILDFNGLLKKGTVAHSTLIIKNLGYKYDESENFKFVEDFDFQLALTLHSGKKIKKIAEPLVYYRIFHGNNIQHVRSAENIFNVYDKYKLQFSQSVLHDLYEKAYMNIAIRGLRTNDSKTGYYLKKLKFYKSRKDNVCLSLLLFYTKLPLIIRKILLSSYYKLRK